MRNKKGALELSVTAIVVLILAIVMLGLGLGFVRGMFGKVSTQFEEQIVAEPEAPMPSGGEPITLSRQAIVTHAKDAEVLKVALYNPTDEDWGSSFANITCTDLDLDSVNVNPKDIDQGASESFNILFTIGKATTTGTYLCYAYGINATYTKDFTIKVIK